MAKLIVTACVLLLMGCGDDATGPSGSGEWQTHTSGGFVLEWRVEDDGSTLHVKASAPTTGWVAVGFDPSVMMEDANLLIGYATDGVGYIRDDFGTGPTSHQPDTLLGGSSDVVLLGSAESGGTTSLEFTLPMNSQDGYDSVLHQGETHTVLLAFGPDGSDDFDSPHQFVLAVELQI